MNATAKIITGTVWPIPSSRLNLTIPHSMPEIEEDRNPTPQVGWEYGLKINEAPCWCDPTWSDDYRILTVLTVRDLLADPLTFDEFSQLATKNIGRYLIDGTVVDGRPLQVFWENVLVQDSFEPEGRFEWEPEAECQPYRTCPLQLVVELSGQWLVVGQFEPTIAGRLELVEAFGRARVASNDHGQDRLRVRPALTDLLGKGDR
ncbi:MAG: hypothetical protein JNK57_15620 [Planctomycetaceae bacterium]|nr:hypothetical protein [Planctomycetaceae bacterium]